MMGRKCCLSAILWLCLGLISFGINAVEVSYDRRAIKIDGKRRLLISGSIHYPRSTPDMWPHLINKAREGGLNVIQTSVFWNAHEPLPRKYDFSGNLDIVRFIRTIQHEGLYAMVQFGPYISGEWTHGGLPVWLHTINRHNMTLRAYNVAFMNEMKTFTTLIVNMLKKGKLFASQGGPIILAQIENEYGDVMRAYGDSAQKYVQWCAKLAKSFELGIPWVMSKQMNILDDSTINTWDGYYCCDHFQPDLIEAPTMWTENWTGGYKTWGRPTPHRTAEDIAYAVATFFQSYGTLQNYYMYHGGTNFGRSAGGPYVTTSYDYDAPLDEYGNLNQPKWGHLRQLHKILMSKEKVLTYGSSSNTEFVNKVEATKYQYGRESICFIGNAHPSRDAEVHFQNNNYTIPAWSVSILPNCASEAYNTAKVNSQTSIMVKKENNPRNDEESTLKWQWREEPFLQMKDSEIIGTVDMIAPKLMDQKSVTNDTTDYLWYITSVDFKDKDPTWSKEFTLTVNTSGHILHAFVNGQHIGTKYAKYGEFKFVYESKVQLVAGTNDISLLSTTVGLKNRGPFFDKVDVGVHGPVHVHSDDSDGGSALMLNLNKVDWYYKVGLHGEHEGYHKYLNSLQTWYTQDIPTNRIFVWYKTMFKSPIGDHPVVVDLNGLGKGHAWVNGNSIGRYWVSYIADKDGCSPTCDYRGEYNPNKCLSECGQPSQRWYHVPRSFLRQDDQNTLVLFEELGGQPFNVKFSIVTVDKICANAYEGNPLELACDKNQVISEIKFASFGLPKGECGYFQNGHCESRNALKVIKEKCLGKDKCSIQVSEKMLGNTKCKVAQNRFAVEALCDIKPLFRCTISLNNCSE